MSAINSGDTAWMLVSTALVMLMTPGLAFFYGGMVRRKNTLSTIMMSFMTLGLIGVLWVLYGYSLSFGNDVGGFIGGLNFLALNNVGQEPSSIYATTIPHLSFAAYQMMFAIITVALITGAVVERMKFSAILVFAAVWFTLVYIPVAHWVWGSGGWLAKMGALDFAGGTVVHITAGISALSLAMLLGPRKDFQKGTPMALHNVPFIVIGAGLLWFGWFGFNAGSALTSGGCGCRLNLDVPELVLPSSHSFRDCNRCCSRTGGCDACGRFHQPDNGFTHRYRSIRYRFLCDAFTQPDKNR
jgi:Amt family ammonium transporter